MTAKEFEKLKPYQKRVAIAKDILEQIKAKRYIARAGSYIESAKLPGGGETPIKKNFNKIKECHVCQIGAIILSTTKFRNKLIKDDVGGGLHTITNNVYEILKDIFSPKQLLLIEEAYESPYCTGDRYAYKIDEKIGLDWDEEDACQDFYDQFLPENYDDLDEDKNTAMADEDRMIAIMRNIIKHRGTFKP